MSNIAFLIAAVALSVIGCAVFLLLHRKPTSLEHGIRSFSKEMAALSPERLRATSRRRGGRPRRLPASHAPDDGR